MCIILHSKLRMEKKLKWIWFIFWKPVEFRLWGNQSVAVRFPEIEMLLLSNFNLHCGCMGGSFFKSIWCFFIYYNFKNIQTSTLLPTLVVNLVMAFFLLTLGSISWKGNTRTYLGFFTACRLHLIFHEISRRHCGGKNKNFNFN